MTEPLSDEEVELVRSRLVSATYLDMNGVARFLATIDRLRERAETAEQERDDAEVALGEALERAEAVELLLEHQAAHGTAESHNTDFQRNRADIKAQEWRVRRDAFLASLAPVTEKGKTDA